MIRTSPFEEGGFREISLDSILKICVYLLPNFFTPKFIGARKRAR
jgi:hypothetical protein